MDYRKDYYQLLELPVTASREQIRAAYRRLAKLYHPDKNEGNPETEEKFKQINEANEVLSNDILKEEYDAYREENERWERAQAEQKKGKDEIKQGNKRNYTRTKTVVTEARIYIRGEIKVKYWADSEQRMAASFDTELDYKITPTEAVVTITDQDIFPKQAIPLDYLKAFKESDIFSMPIPQPVRCEVTGEQGTEYFELPLTDIRIKNIRLEGITKHEQISYGTLTGLLYAYTPKVTDSEVEETVTECFGETGKVEQKEENGFSYLRKEYYHPDCTTYWGNWIPLAKPKTASPSNKSSQRNTAFFKKNYTERNTGCGLFSWIIALLIILFLSPQLFIICLLIIGIGMLLNYGGPIFSSLSRFLSFVGTILLILFLIKGVQSATNHERTYIKKKAKTASIKTTREIRKSSLSADSAKASPDTLISHLLKWQDYAGHPYQGTLSISVAALRKGNEQHQQMSRSFYQNMSEIYKTMLDNDSSQLYYLYETFDSIRATNNLDEVAFSQVLVSAIQSLPYFLVVDKSCDENYNDDFTRNYLANCITDCCVGNELFGVRSPVEFLSDLKGDCDTRSLLLYQMLKHYNYNVALLTSNYYRHAMIAVSFKNETDQPGLGFTIGDRKYYMWETTSPDLNYGVVSSSFNNLSYWDISLINKRIQ